MSFRRVIDQAGVHWEVYDVPAPMLRRARASDTDQLQSSAGELKPPALRSPVSGRLANGWLCFESATDRRRIAPIPAQWEQVPDEELLTLLALAVPAPKQKKG